tara:strand:- start:8099 stop:9142 length:1044 start_codon:yes stop_codon:yes gene_type:complete
MKKILLIATVYRCGERVYSTIPELSKIGNIDLLVVGQMSPTCLWYGDNDLRLDFLESYKKYLRNVYDAGLTYQPKRLDIDISQYDLILYDDQRNRHGIHIIYKKAKANNIPMIGCTHGAGKCDMEGESKVYDYLLVFGNTEVEINNSHPKIKKIGIPSNDILKTYRQTNEHILVIVNFLGNRGSKPSISTHVDEDFITQTGLKQLQEKFNKKIVFKLKSRQDHPYPEKDIAYLHDIIKGSFDYDIIIDGDNDKIVAESFIVISCPSTLSFKPIQLGIPTVLIKGTQAPSAYFDKYKGLVDLDTQTIHDEIQRQHDHGKDTQFILDTIEGGVEFNSTEYFIKAIREII